MTDFELIDTDQPAEFFAPVETSLIDALLGQYQATRSKLERVADFASGDDMKSTLGYFADHASKLERHMSMHVLNKMFEKEPAIAYLNAAFWSKVMVMTGVLNIMPQARRDAWNRQMIEPLGVKKDRYSNEYLIEPIPEFTPETVKTTVIDLLNQRSAFFAERVDGIFQKLSKTHVTNAPEGFGRRMIIAHVFGYYSSTMSDSGAGVINDLRCVIAKFMGRDEPGYGDSHSILKYAQARKTGQWVSVDGGALRVKCYQVGTAHLEVHPDMVWRLNSVLASLYPLAIPSEFREKPKKKPKNYVMIGRPLPFKVLEVLAKVEQAYRFVDGGPRSTFGKTREKIAGVYSVPESSAGKEVWGVLKSLGGVMRGAQQAEFDYCPLEVIKEITISGCVPDQKAHQFYPTPEKLAKIAVELADIGEHDVCLEPSAGMGGIADFMPKDRTRCIEISPLHCKVLEKKGFEVVCGDFLEVKDHAKYSRIIMNPPFSEGRWQAHTLHAAGMVSAGGRLVAILPSSAKGKFELDGFDCEYHGPYHNEFAGTSISVVILVANKI